MGQRALHQLDLAENEYLELAGDRFQGKKFSRVKMASTRIVDQHVEIACFGDRGIERLVNGARISQIQADRVPSRHFRDALYIARRTPNLMTLGHQFASFLKHWPPNGRSIIGV